MFGIKEALFESERLTMENKRLRSENEALRARVAALESRKAKQWDNLLGYDGRAQRDNLGGAGDA